MKVKVIVDGLIYPKGKIINVPKEEAKEAIKEGKVKPIEEEVKETEEDDTIISKINESLKAILGKTPLEIDEEISRLADKTKKSKTILNKQFIELQKRERTQNELETKNFPSENLEKNIGNAFNKKEIVEKILEMQPCYYDKARNWWLWNWLQHKWERVDETDILNAVERQATINTISSKEKNELLEAIKQVSRLKKPQEVSPDWIQFKDKLVDIKTGKRIDATPWYFVTNPIPWELHEHDFYQTPNMDRIFEEWVGKENVQKLYEILSYCLIPDYPIHRIFCFIGSGMNGKSCFLNLLRKFIGNDNCCSSELDTLLTSRFEVTRLHKKLVCQMGETNFTEMSKTSILKKLSGGDLIGFEYKNKDPFEEKNYAKIIIATNNLPATTDKTIGFYRRWMIVDFPNQFTEKKDILKDIPDEEYQSLALKCTLILKDLIKERKFTNEGSIDDRMKAYEDYSNPLEKFINEYVEEDHDSFIWKYEFQKKLNQWCKENRFREISDVAIGKKMKELGINQQLKRTNDLSNPKRYRAWVGIKFKGGIQSDQDEQEDQVRSG